MSLTPTQRQTREWPWLVMAVALVAFVCYPLYQWAWGPEPQGPEWMLILHGLARRMLQPEQIACYACFTWAIFILLQRFLELRRQRQALQIELLPTEEGVRILPEDARPLQRKVEQLSTRHGPLILANMIRLALSKYAVTRSGQDVSETIRTQAEVDLGRLVASMSTVNYLAWALPALGFLGTVRGLAGSLAQANNLDQPDFIKEVSTHLGVAFDCTLVALVLSIVLMFLLHSMQRDEEALVIDCRQYCLEHLVNRLYDLEPVHETV